MLKKIRINFKLKLIIIFFFIILSVDFIYTNINKYVFPFDFEDPKSKIYKNFKPNLKRTYISPITGKTLFCTDSNGFRSDCSNLNEKKFDYLIIGNIFAEGSELDFQDTFVGQIIKKSDLKFANLGNRSLNLIGINKKISDIIKNDYVEFKEVILLIGPRIFYDNSKLDNLDNMKNNQFIFKKFVMNNFYFFNNFYNWFLFNIDRTKLWAYSKSNHYSSNIKIEDSFVKNLNNIYLDLKKNNKKLSIVIYPYPYHFLYKDFDKRFIYFLEDFCENKCNSFVNTYPVFNSKIEKENIWDFIDKIYHPYSVHFSKFGSQIIADTIIKSLK